MKCLAFDSGPIISLATNNLLWILEGLKKEFQGEFLIAESVKKELVTTPLLTKRFKFEALQVEALVEKEVLKEKKTNEGLAEELFALANNTFFIQNQPLALVQKAEMETLALSIQNKCSAVVIDERITRSLIENPNELAKILSGRLHKKIRISKNESYKFRELCENISIIRSAELAAIAYEKGILDKFIVNIPNSKRTLLESVLWGVKLNGCALTENEINKIVRMERL